MANKKKKGLYAKVKGKVKRAVTWGINKLFATSGKDGADIHARAKKRKKALEAAGKTKD